VVVFILLTQSDRDITEYTLPDAGKKERKSGEFTNILFIHFWVDVQ